MAKEDFCFTYYARRAYSDISHMTRSERGAYQDIILQQVRFGRLTLGQIKAALGADFDDCWPALELVLGREDDLYFITWLDRQTRTRPRELTATQVAIYIEQFRALEPSPFGPPSCAGVYGVFVFHPKSERERLIYIGSSNNVRKRVMALSHPYRRAYSRFDNLYVYTKTLETDDYIDLEKHLIRYFKPWLNISLRNG